MFGHDFLPRKSMAFDESIGFLRYYLLIGHIFKHLVFKSKDLYQRLLSPPHIRIFSYIRDVINYAQRFRSMSMAPQGRFRMQLDRCQTHFVRYSLRCASQTFEDWLRCSCAVSAYYITRGKQVETLSYTATDQFNAIRIYSSPKNPVI